MAVVYFGNYLVESGFITRDQLEEAWSVQPSDRLLGLAVSKGILLPAEIERLRELYGNSSEGLIEKAIRNKSLPEAQADYLRRMLKNDWRGLSDVLVHRGYLTAEARDQAIADYRVRQSGYQPTNQPLPEHFHGRGDIAALLGLLSPMFEEVAQLGMTWTAPSLVEGARLSSEHAVGIELSGDFSGSVAMDADQPIAAELALWISAGAITELTPDIWRDACGEYLNVVVGNAAAVLSAYGSELVFSAPRSFAGSGEAPAAQFGLYLEATTLQGTVRILFT